MKTVKQLRKGEWFTRKDISHPDERQVLIRGDYDREAKKYCCQHWDDINSWVMLKGDAKAYTDFIF